MSKRSVGAAASVAWFAALGITALLGVGAGALLRADQRPATAIDAADVAIARALGAPTGVLAVVNPVNCALTAQDATALNAIASVPGVRVRVLLLAISASDSVILRIRRDFGFSPAVVIAPAASVDPRQLPEMFRRPLIAVVSRGQLQHAAWGLALKNIHAWLPQLTGLPAEAQPRSAQGAS